MAHTLDTLHIILTRRGSDTHGITVTGQTGSESEAEELRRLIAAAPAMLDVLRHVANAPMHLDTHDRCDSECFVVKSRALLRAVDPA